MVMFTLEQINDIHERLASAKTFTEQLRALKAIDMGRMTMTFCDRAGREMLVEQIT